MENNLESAPEFKIELPTVGDEAALAPMHIQAWKESYITPESGVTGEMVDTMMGHMLTNTDYRKRTIIEALANPDKVLYRVVKNSDGNIVGFLHGTKSEECNELEAIYLLNEAKGSGTGGKLMEEFLAWADKSKPSHLEVFTFNDRALSFYKKYGFSTTDEPVRLFKDKLPFVSMIRPADLIEKP